MRSPSAAGVEQTPSCGQSFTGPLGSFSWTACQRNLPVFSSKHMRMPRSIGSCSPVWAFFFASRGFRGRPLLVPTKIFPPQMMGPP